MASRSEVEQFLAEFHTKCNVFGISLLARTNPKNTETLLRLDISLATLKEIIESLQANDYVSGPMDDTLYDIAKLWVFGLSHKSCELYIKISLGRPNCSALCISFHIAQHPLNYQFK